MPISLVILSALIAEFFQGLLDSIAYGSSTNMHNAYYELFCEKLNKCWKDPNASDRTTSVEISTLSTSATKKNESSLFTVYEESIDAVHSPFSQLN